MTITPPVGCDVESGRGSSARWRLRPSSDQVGLVDDGARLAAGDADEDAFVQPVEIGRGGFDLGRGAERVFARVDVLASAEAGEHFGAAVANAARLDVEQGAVVGPQRVADVAERRAIRQHYLPVGADAPQ